MKKVAFYVLFILQILCSGIAAAQMINGSKAEGLVPGSEAVIPGKYSPVPDYVRFRNEVTIAPAQFDLWLAQHYTLPAGTGFKLLAKEPDNLGFVHYRLQQTVNGLPVEGTMYILHTKAGRIQSMNGQILTCSFPNNTGAINKATALSNALNYVGATTYKWQIPGAEATLKELSGNPDATYYPAAELVYIPENGKLDAKQMHLAYKFDIYAQKPLSRNYVYVDAVSGKVIHTTNRIESVNAQATAQTGYSGTRTITVDSTAATSHRLQETGRGSGIVTKNAQSSTNTGSAVDFTNATTVWNNVNANKDQYATDAHLASEATYDFYKNNFNRNSIDNAGLQLVAYVHYDSQLDNAFWDGAAMNYGDGSAQAGTNPYTTLDVGGHEITHGLTQYTANLNYQDESGGLNESFSDCMGTSIRQSIYQSANVDYLIGDQLGTNTTFRSMAAPKLYQQPNTYQGQYWVAAGGPDNGGVHTNSGVQNYWFYLVAHGGSGTNDSSWHYNVTGITINKAAAITFRNLTVYLTPASQYADSRTYSIQAANDLYGACSQEVKTVTNAWYAVAVGDSFTGSVHADFNESATTFCSAPGTISFTNASSNGAVYSWDFGDGSAVATTGNATHTYNAYGTYTVKLSVSSACGADSVIKTQLIHINNDAPTAGNQNICSGQSATLNAAAAAGAINWYSAASGGSALSTGTSFITPALSTSTTYYAETDITGPVNSCGPVDNTFGGGGYFTNTNQHSVIFNCTSPQILLSVDVYAGAAGSRTIFLTDSAGNTLQTTSVNIPSGHSTVMLNFPLPVANSMYLAVTGTTNLYRNNSGAIYPYNSTDGTVVLTNSDAGQGGYYYFFYNWQLQAAPCVSARTPVVVNVVNGGSNFTYNAAGTNVSFNPAATGLTSYQWSFGDGHTSALQNPTNDYSADGTYTVTLIQSNGSCTDTVTQVINLISTVVKVTGKMESLSVFPDPASDVLNVQAATGKSDDWNLSIHNLLGESVSEQKVHLNQGSNLLALNVALYASGVYFISLQNGTNIETRRFIKGN